MRAPLCYLSFSLFHYQFLFVPLPPCPRFTHSRTLLTRPVTLHLKNGAAAEARPRKCRSAVHSAADGAIAAISERGEGFRWRIRFGSGVELYTNVQ